MFRFFKVLIVFVGLFFLSPVTASFAADGFLENGDYVGGSGAHAAGSYGTRVYGAGAYAPGQGHIAPGRGHMA